MPICFCKTAGCLDHGGIDRVSGEPKGCKVDYRTYEKHAMYEDRARRFEDTQKRSDEAVEAQLEEITSFLSANTLADNVSGTSAGAGGHLWARCTPEGDDYSDETLPDNDTLHEHSGTSTHKSQTDISKTLHLIEESLEGGEKQWNQELEKIRKEQSPQQGIAFDTG
ncbi:hypothetical protein CPB84DRAFT_1749903 [Gymnopilus junonius]|uniref:Uncharacterized protein n=1 Tax=Gymnopilus junonius TaxID=109634 RepID=A0A9P5NGH4_GYMJU|nr:hypothetical protein CPB84DRAFT_1749903 [Gymnopilus junonius]